jgi:hypothetical protein
VFGQALAGASTASAADRRPGPPQYSLAKTLVGWIGDYAYRAGVELKGENALSGGVQYGFGWNQINDAFDRWGYLGLTVLRMSDVSYGTGARRYPRFIEKYSPFR